MQSIETQDEFKEHFVISFRNTLSQFLAEIDKKIGAKLMGMYGSVTNKHAEESLNHFYAVVNKFDDLIVQRDDSFFNQEIDTLLPDVSMDIVKKVHDLEKARTGLWKYLQLFLLLAKQYNGDDNIAALAQQLQAEPKKQRLAKKKDSQSENSSSVSSSSSSSSSFPSLSPSGNAFSSLFDLQKLKDDPFLKKIETSKIAQMAKEFAKELDFAQLASSLGVTGTNAAGNSNPISSILENLGKDPSVLQNMMKRVGEVVQKQMKSDELGGDVLKGEVEEIISSLKQSPVVNSIFEGLGSTSSAAGLNMLKGLVQSSVKDLTGNSKSLDADSLQQIDADMESMWSATASTDTD